MLKLRDKRTQLNCPRYKSKARIYLIWGVQCFLLLHVIKLKFKLESIPELEDDALLQIIFNLSLRFTGTALLKPFYELFKLCLIAKELN